MACKKGIELARFLDCFFCDNSSNHGKGCPSEHVALKLFNKREEIECEEAIRKAVSKKKGNGKRKKKMRKR